MKMTARHLALVIGFTTLCAHAADSVPMIRGVVQDETGAALAGVNVQVTGQEKLRNGTWIRIIELGWPAEYKTDKDGRFTIPLHQTDVRYDLSFDQAGFAPAFLSGISSQSPELNVVLKRGMLLTGTVAQMGGAHRTPVGGTIVELYLSNVDVWYQERTVTDKQGKYEFHVTPPPPGRKWEVWVAGVHALVDVKEGQPVTGPNFLITVEDGKEGTPARQTAPRQSAEPR